LTCSRKGRFRKVVVADVGSKRHSRTDLPRVCYPYESGRIAALQRNDAQCRKRKEPLDNTNGSEAHLAHELSMCG